MVPDLLTVLGVGSLLGFRHAFEPDHLAAVSTLASRQGKLLQASWLGLAWGVGHTASVGAVVLLVIAGGLKLPETFRPAAELAVAFLLIALGLPILLRYARGRWHMHLHAHDGTEHLHLHSHAAGRSHLHAHPAYDVHRSVGFGLAHGLAGSAAIVVLLVAAAPTRAAQLAYFGAFGAGTVLGMLLVSGGVALLVRLASRRSASWATVLHVGSAAASVAVGLMLVGRIVGEFVPVP